MNYSYGKTLDDQGASALAPTWDGIMTLPL